MLRIGIIGTGGMGRLHATSLGKIGEALVVAAADASPEALRAFAQDFRPQRTYEDFRALVGDSEVDAVVICLPTYLHHLAVAAAAAAGKHVFCEKPISLDVRSAEGMVAACERAEVHLMMGFVRRFDNDWGTFKRMFEEGAIGRPVVWRHVIASGGPRNPWYLDKDMGGGPIVDGAIHDIDFANWLFGEAAWFTGSARSLKSSSYDTATVSIGYENGDELLLSWTWGLPYGALGLLGQDAIGPGGAILFPGSIPAQELPSDLDPEKTGAYLLDRGSTREPRLFEKNDMFLDEMRHFVHCCVSGEKPAVRGEDGLKAIKTCLSALERARKV